MIVERNSKPFPQPLFTDVPIRNCRAATVNCRAQESAALSPFSRRRGERKAHQRLQVLPPPFTLWAIAPIGILKDLLCKIRDPSRQSMPMTSRHMIKTSREILIIKPLYFITKNRSQLQYLLTIFLYCPIIVRTCTRTLQIVNRLINIICFAPSFDQFFSKDLKLIN